MADSTRGYGTTVAISTTYGGTYTPLAQIRDVTDPGLEVENVDTSHMASPGQAREKEPDWISAGNVSFKMLYSKAQHSILWGLAAARVTRFFRITTPDGMVQIFEGFVSKISREIPMAGRIEGDVEITVSGLPTFS